MINYDEFAEDWAEHMRSGKNSAHTYLEKPAMYAKLPDLTGKTILCIGCGSGEECQYFASLGASRVVGIDLSDGLISVARKSYPELEFEVMDMEKLAFENEEFDFVYSSLVMHYKPSWLTTLREVRRVMKADTKFLFSTHHPALWSARVERNKDDTKKLLGYDRRHGNEEVYGDYLNSRQIHDTWFEGKMNVTYFHKPLSEVFIDIRDSGLKITDFIEPKAVEACKDVDPSFYEIHQKIPLFMIIELSN